MKRSMTIRRGLPLWGAVLCTLLLCLLAVCGAQAAPDRSDGTDGQTEPAAVGVLSGTNTPEIVSSYFPDAEILRFNSTADQVNALKSGKVDAVAIDEPVARNIQAEDPALTMAPELLGSMDYAYALGKSPSGEALCEELSAYLRSLKDDGTLEELQKKWFDSPDLSAVETMDYRDLPPEKGTIRLAAFQYPPFILERDSLFAGYEIELIALFCRDRGYALEIRDMSNSAILPAVQTGKCDIGCSCISVTEERKENVLFSEPDYSGGTALLLRKAPGDGARTGKPEYESFDSLRGKTISMLTGAPFEEMILAKVQSVKEFTYFSSMPDMLLAVKSGKSDACLLNNAVAELAVNRDGELSLFPESLGDASFGIAFAKGDPRRDEWQAAYDRIPEETKQAMWSKWTGADERAKTLPAQDWPGTGGRISVAACDTLEPMSYAGEDGQPIGFDIEMILRMAKELDVRVSFTGMEFASVLSSVESGKAALGCGSIIVTEERQQAVDFVEYYPASFVLLVRTAEGEEESASVLTGVKESFGKTFLRENRWKLFVEGIGNTMLITVCSLLFGTLLGFGAYMLCRGGNPAANGITRFAVWLVKGMPMVVLLMILYYIIFGRAAVSGVLVAIIGFTLTFGAAVYGMLRVGVGAVDKGQMEAASALGYPDRRAFYRVVLPQAIPHIVPVYRGEVVALIKATAIVGYIAVQDLTRMGDIVRSRTYEAFFPLIAVAIVYFILAAVLTAIVNRLALRFDWKRRGEKEILKGVKPHD